MLTIAVEDRISEAVAAKVANLVCGDKFGTQTIVGHGYGGLKKRMSAFRAIAQTRPVWLLTDLDRVLCPSVLITNWTGGTALPEKLCFRVAVREIEAWLLADREAMAELLGLSVAKIVKDPEAIGDPKEYLLNLARQAKNRNIRSELVPKKGTTASQGFGYNPVLCEFVTSKWSPERASDASRSLAKAMTRLSELLQRQ
ncbi:hypothetical protein HUU61_17920 [Rhodopseudomonas palustris]|nr:hypothetical protein [Rhodopseudomonas palustris]